MQKYILSKGFPINVTKNNIEIYNTNNIYSLTKEQSIVWNFFYANCKSIEQFHEYVKLNPNISNSFLKNPFNQAIYQLKSLDLLCIEPATTKEIALYYILAKNKIKVQLSQSDDCIKCFNKEIIILDNLKKIVYNMLINQDMFLADIILEIDHNEKRFDFFTDGKTEEYIEFAKQSPTKNKIIEILEEFLTHRIISIE